jgi:hypothetical protein
MFLHPLFFFVFLSTFTASTTWNIPFLIRKRHDSLKFTSFCLCSSLIRTISKEFFIEIADFYLRVDLIQSFLPLRFCFFDSWYLPWQVPHHELSLSLLVYEPTLHPYTHSHSTSSVPILLSLLTQVVDAHIATSPPRNLSVYTLQL